jgi:hypothetical protein
VREFYGIPTLVKPVVWKLYHLNGAEVALGDEVTDFRGDKAKVVGMEAPHNPGSTGRVYIRRIGSGPEEGYFPVVYGLTWRNDA